MVIFIYTTFKTIATRILIILASIPTLLALLLRCSIFEPNDTILMFAFST